MGFKLDGEPGGVDDCISRVQAGDLVTFGSKGRTDGQKDGSTDGLTNRVTYRSNIYVFNRLISIFFHFLFHSDPNQALAHKLFYL